MRFQPSYYSEYAPGSRAPTYGITDEQLWASSDKQPSPEGGKTGAGAAVVLPVVVGLLTIPTFVLNPWLVKAFKPEWPYWRRVGVGMGITAVAGMLTGIVRAGAGKK